MSTFDKISIVIVFGTLLFLGVYYVIFHRKHKPSQQLSESQKEHVLLYGVLHFTTARRLSEIQSDMKLYPGKPLLCDEKNMIWLYINDGDFETNLDLAYQRVSKTRKNSNVCIVLTGFSTANLLRFLCRKSDTALVHLGPISLRYLEPLPSPRDDIVLYGATVAEKEIP